jgi:hypothetical protein
MERQSHIVSPFWKNSKKWVSPQNGDAATAKRQLEPTEWPTMTLKATGMYIERLASA